MTKKTYAQLAWGFLQVLTVMLAMTWAGPWASAKELTVFVSEGETVTFRRPIKRIFLAEKTIADIQVADEKTVFIFGQKPGRTTLIALDSNGREVANYSIVVTYNDRDLMRLIRKDVGDVPIELIRSANGAVLRGQVQTLEMAEKISGLVSQYTGGGTDIVNQLTITGSQQVHLKVRVAEVSRSAVRNLGINWDVVASSGSFAFGLVTGRQLAVPGAKIPVPGALSGKLKSSGSDINALVDALASDGLVKILAEPNLTAVSGQKATFLAGGEFPFPVPQPNNQPGIQFRQFGVSLEFTPKIISNNIISMVVRPEVSDISSQNGTIVNGTAIPAISSQRTKPGHRRPATKPHAQLGAEISTVGRPTHSWRTVSFNKFSTQ
jgi:pilus assembly protein CpaC